MRASNTPCYLTGGTALSRGYFNHRYSDDLDFFMTQEDAYSKWVQKLLGSFEAAQASGLFSIDFQRILKYENFTQIFLIKTLDVETIELKIDIVNDVASHYGDFVQHAVLGTLDSWQNILSNKLTAIFRYEAKDIVDIWVLAKSHFFDWKMIVQEAKTKEAGIDPVVLFEILRSFPESALKTIKWVVPIAGETFRQDVNQIADDILQGRENSLYSFAHDE